MISRNCIRRTTKSGLKFTIEIHLKINF